jgi:hypothetical protein
VLIFSQSFSQDKIYRNNGKIVEAKIIEIGSDEIKYKEFNNPDGPIYVLETDKIKKIVFENGTTQKFEDNLRDPERYAGQAKRAIKVNFLSPLYGYFEVGYEKSTGVGKGYEVSLGIIGAGKSEQLEYYNSSNGQFATVHRGQLGAFASIGYKFGKLPDFVIFGKTKMSHLMQGTYAKPILYLGHYKENQVIEKAGNTYEVGEQQVTFGALQIELGKQWVFSDKFLLDLYFGFGYGADNKKDAYQYQNGSGYYYDDFDGTAAYNYANARAGRSPGFSVTYGLKFGFLIK